MFEILQMFAASSLASFGNQSINHVCAILCASTQSLLGTQMHAIIDFDRNNLQAVDFIKLHIFEGLYIYHQITSGAFGFLMKKCYVSVLISVLKLSHVTCDNPG